MVGSVDELSAHVPGSSVSCLVSVLSMNKFDHEKVSTYIFNMV
jgi:hypothetical protein